MEKRYVFRADASPQVGAGHVMRVSAIAEELLNRGLRVSLVGEISEIGWLEKRVESMCRGLRFVSEEIFTSNPSSDVIIIDSYNIDIKSSFLARKNWLRTVAIIEIETPKYQADLFIHCGTNLNIQNDYMIENSRFIGGIKYLPIRRSIREINFNFDKNKDSKLMQILVIGGGTDPFGFVRCVGEFLNKTDLEFRAILVSESPTILDSLDYRFEKKVIGNELEIELLNADLVLTLAGTSSWDFLSCGIPIGVAIGAENQRDNFEFQKLHEIAAEIGSLSKIGKFNFDLENIVKLIENFEFRKKLSIRASKTVDKFGVYRIADELELLG